MTRTPGELARDLLIEWIETTAPEARGRPEMIADAVQACVRAYGLPATIDAVTDRLTQAVRVANELRAAAEDAAATSKATAAEIGAMRRRARELRQDAAYLRQAARKLLLGP